MTYLQLVNQVLRKLREEPVTTVNENDYSTLIGIFINDSINAVEASWDWSSLRKTLDITTYSGQDTYPLINFGIRGEVMYVYNTNNKNEIRQKTKAYIDDKRYKTDNLGMPYSWALKGTDTNNNTNIIFYPKPDKEYIVSVDCVIRNESLVSDADATVLPVLPIIQLAFAYALREKGETGGQGAMEQNMYADKDLANAIALDAANNAGELVFDVI
tara:strand:+ start:72 stop:716 length:645 start_codon:yes stop_codon:yes gene_type:complete